MSSTARVFLGVLAFIALLGVFLFVQRNGNESSTPATSPPVTNFEPEQGQPVLVSPGTDTAPAIDPAGLPDAPGSTRKADTGPQLRVPTNAGSTAAAGLQPASPSASPEPAATRPAMIQSSGGISPGGPGSGVDPSLPVEEMISLPPSGPGPQSAVPASSALPPEHGSTESAMAPEMGSSGVDGPGPELLPVTHPGPSGEMPGPAPQDPQ